jgi:hypothetical protein
MSSSLWARIKVLSGMDDGQQPALAAPFRLISVFQQIDEQDLKAA